MSLPKVYYNNDKTSFAFSTCQKRWPIIIQNAIDDVAEEIEKSTDTELSEQGKVIQDQLLTLKDDLVNDAEIQPFNDDSVPGLNSFDNTLKNFNTKVTWLTGPWLYLECYLYRKINLFFVKKSKWSKYDIFEKLKRETFKSSSFGVYELALRYKQLYDEITATGTKNLDEETLKFLFTEFIDISLWGNATDLSLLANATLEDIKSVQGAEARKKSEKNILTNDLPEAWIQLKNSSTKRVDFILDNAGFENFTDLILTLFLLDTGLAKEVVFHCKTRPWMVSDTMIKDFDILLQDLSNTLWFPEHRTEMNFLVSQLNKYHGLSQLKLVEHEFWTIDLDYWNINEKETKFGGSEVYKLLKPSDLIIVKGDLNYRKLTGDRQWPRSTPFVEGIGSLSKSGLKILALRTCKADVCLGLEEGKDEELSEYWRSLGNEVGELWCSSGKWAVISYSDGDSK